MPTLRHCIKCGEHIVVGDRFCAHCGAEQPSTLGGESSEKGASRWDDIEKRLQAATEGRYHIRGLIGRGGMAAVYLADWPNMDLRIAIKVMDPYLLDQETFVQRFLQEARTIAKLRHRHIIRVYDSGQAGDLFYFCMDYYPGRSMEQVLEGEGQVPIPVVKLWLSQAADALGYAHRQPKPVVHRDVKPSNMLLDKEGDVVLTDFGIAKVREVDQTLPAPSLTMPGAVLGTPTYLSPEQAAVILNSGEAPTSSQASSASDQYSLGVVGYEMLCGQPPFSGDLAPLCVAHAEKEPPDILKQRPECPPDLAQIVSRMLRKRPKDRWPSMESICSALAAPSALSGSPLRAQVAGLARGHRPVGSISLTPPSGEFFVGQSVRLKGTPLDLAGRPIQDRPLSWKSSDPDVALVTEDGTVKALQPGPVSIRATAEGVSGELRLAVAPVRVDTVVVLPSELAIPEGEEQVLRVLLLSRDGEELKDREITWTSNDPEVASVESGGGVKAHQRGSTTVIASSEGRMGRAKVTVIPAPVASVEISPSTLSLPVGEAEALDCSLRDVAGKTLEGRAVEWTVNDPSVVEITEAGKVRGVTPGTTTITATVDGVVAVGSVTVHPHRAASLELSPGSGELQEGASLQLQALPLSARGKPLPERAVLWTTSDPEVARVDGEGRVEGVAQGEARITATCDGATASAGIRVSPAPVAAVELFPSSLSLETRETAHLAATLKGPVDQTLADRPVSWSSSDPSVAEVDSRGWIKAVASGEAVITVECQGHSASAEIKVAPAPVAELEISSDSLTLEVGESGVLEAAPKSRSGVFLKGREVRWESSAPQVVQVDESGRIEARALGEAEVVLTSEGVSRRVAVTVVPRQVVGVEISPASLEIVEGESTRAQAVPKAKDGQPIQGRTVTWSSDDPQVAQVDSEGGILGVKAGAITIRARCEDASGDLQVTVLPEPVATLRVEPREVEISAGESLELSLEVFGETGRALEGRPATWSSSHPTVAEVSEQGRVTAKAPGSAVLTTTCQGQSVSTPVSVLPERVESVLIDSSKTTVEVGDTLSLACSVRGTSGREILDRQVTWTSSDPATARVDAEGRVSALAPGEVSVSASCEGREEAVSLTVAPPAVASLEVEPREVSILPGDALELDVTVTDVRGQTVQDRPVTWTSSEDRIVRIEGEGRVRGVAQGRATLAVSCGGVSAQVPVEVRPVPVQSLTIKTAKSHLKARKSDEPLAVVTGTNGEDLTGREVRWESSDSTVAEVSSSGRVRGFKPGTARITARCDDASDSYLLTVEAAGGLPAWAPWGLGGGAVVVVVGLGLWQLLGGSGSTEGGGEEGLSIAAMALTPGDSVSLDPGSTLALGVTARNDAGDLIPSADLPSLRWEVSDDEVATISQAGVLRGLSPGVAMIRASLPSSEEQAPLEVVGKVVVAGETATRVAQVQMEGPESAVEGDRLQFRVVALDSTGAETGGETVEWSSSDPRVAAVSGSGSAGEVQALRPGSVTIRARIQGVTGTHRLVVSPAPAEDVQEAAAEPAATRIRLSPPGTELLEGTTLQLRILDQDGNPVSGSFRVNDPSVASVTSRGELTGLRAGSVVVTALYAGLEATATFQVSAPPPEEPSAALLDSLRTTIQEARQKAADSDFPAAYELLDRSGARIDSLRARFTEASTLGELYAWFIGEYRATTRDCEIYVEALTGLPGVELPTCKPPPGGGGAP